MTVIGKCGVDARFKVSVPKKKRKFYKLDPDLLPARNFIRAKLQYGFQPSSLAPRKFKVILKN